MSALNDHLADYLRIRRQLGFELETAGRNLATFVAFLERAGAERITSELALEWACQPRASERYHGLRLGYVRGFAQYLVTLDPKSEIPPAGLLSTTVRRITPYLYCQREITELMAAADELTPPLKAATYRTIIGLLAATGIRIGEALAMDRDVRLDDGMLCLRVAKQQKQRDVPLHETTTTALREYTRVRDQARPQPCTMAFFFSTSGQRIDGSTFDQVFRTLLRQVKPRPGTEKAHRRAHDLRHTFAVQTLVRWHHAGVDVDRAPPRLSTYLGHYAGDLVKRAPSERVREAAFQAARRRPPGVRAMPVWMRAVWIRQACRRMREWLSRSMIAAAASRESTRSVSRRLMIARAR
ncbi:MAG: tyrosine-type recombinase/integrase, partial [Solirubrobacteraceae bacterium]